MSIKAKEANFKWDNGDTLRDKVSGIEGVVMVRAEYSTGCHHYGLLPLNSANDAKIPDWNWLDQSRLELVEKHTVNFKVNPNSTSGPMPTGPEA